MKIYKSLIALAFLAIVSMLSSCEKGEGEKAFPDYEIKGIEVMGPVRNQSANINSDGAKFEIIAEIGTLMYSINCDGEESGSFMRRDAPLICKYEWGSINFSLTSKASILKVEILPNNRPEPRKIDFIMEIFGPSYFRVVQAGKE